MHPAAAFDFRKLTDCLGESALMPGASEAHGMLCGLVCSGAPGPEQRWLKELLAEGEPQDVPVREAAQSLRSLAEQIRAQLDNPGPGPMPLLPDEAASLRERALGLFDWTRGFLFGIGVAGLDAADLAGQTLEVFEDFTAITRMELDAIDEDKENEQSLAELQEFVSVAARLVYEECSRRGGGA